jgi:hypothetical protein
LRWYLFWTARCAGRLVQREDWRPEVVERKPEAHGRGDPAEAGGMEELLGVGESCEEGGVK